MRCEAHPLIRSSVVSHVLSENMKPEDRRTRRKAWYADSRRIKSMEFWPPGGQIFLWLVWDFEKSATILETRLAKRKRKHSIPGIWWKFKRGYRKLNALKKVASNMCVLFADRFFVSKFLYRKLNCIEKCIIKKKINKKSRIILKKNRFFSKIVLKNIIL